MAYRRVISERQATLKFGRKRTPRASLLVSLDHSRESRE